MKREINSSAIKSLKSMMRSFGCLVVLLLANSFLYAQDTTAHEEAAVEMAKTRMSLTVNQFPDGKLELHGLLRARVSGSYQKVPDAEIAFYTMDDEGNENPIGKANTKADGVATWIVENGSVNATDAGYHFGVRFGGDARFSDSEADLQLLPAKLVAEPHEADSAYTITLHASATTPDGPMPIAGAPVKVFVKRMFSQLKVAEGETDEEGNLEVDFPAGLSGDQDANLFITARIDDTDEYGTLEAGLTEKWGKAVSYEIQKLPKALWSPHPPTWMVITFFILMGTVWIHYLIIVINLFRIKAEKG